MTFTVAELAAPIGGKIFGDDRTPITGLASADSAAPGDLTFAENEKYFAAANASQASAILVSRELTSPGKVLLVVPNVRIAIAKLLPLFHPPEQFETGIHPSATIHPTAQVDPKAHIGPNCILAARVRVGAHSVLMGGNNIGADSQLGDQVTLHPNVVLYPRTRVGHRVAIHAGTVIGSDGYGYVFDQGHHRKVLQVGNVIIEDDVEIGANAAIDRAALGSTIIGQGTKIDNLVHVAHNVVMGKHCLVMGQVGFAGSTHLGDYCVIASQSGIAGHLKLGQQSTVGAKSGVMRDIPDGGTVLGIPAMPDKQTKRQWIAVQQLPDMIRQLRDLQKELHALKSSSAAEGSSSAPNIPAA
jgi:UDP-3-O-[3-hydroxymyristoyl] glucosamine N-acyltransferase